MKRRHYIIQIPITRWLAQRDKLRIISDFRRGVAEDCARSELRLCCRTIWCHSTNKEMGSAGPVHSVLQRRERWQINGS